MDSAPDFLSLLAPDDRRALEAAAMRREYPRGSIILGRGDDPVSVLILLDGRVKVAAPGAEGREAVLDFLGPGELIGELGAVDGRQRSSSVTALEPVTALALPGSGFRGLIKARPAIGMALLRVVCARLRASDTERVEFDTHDVLGRVACRLVELCERYGASRGGGVAITLPLTQEELAGWTGASREAVSKSLAKLRSLGWVETHRRELVVTDMEALRTYAA